jgi:hypothetical protein
MTLNFQLYRTAIVAFCNKWQVKTFSLFGSALRADFSPESDVDVLLSFLPTSQWSLFDQVEMIEDLEAIFKRNVDLITQKGLERSTNAARQKRILESARVIHAA